MNQPNSPPYEDLVRQLVQDEQAFLRLTFGAPLPPASAPWQKVSIRPVLLQGRRQLQFSHFDGRRNVVKNSSGEEALKQLNELLEMSFSRIELQSTAGDLHVRVTRKGNALVTRGKPSRTAPADLAHNRPKQYPLPAEDHGAFLYALGITNGKGNVRPTMQGKFHQVNEFLRVLDQVVDGSQSGDSFQGSDATACDGDPVPHQGQGRMSPGSCPPTETLHIVDCGCGSAYLAFAAQYYLQHVRRRSVEIVGVDVNAELMAKVSQLRDHLRMTGVEFVVCRILDFEPDRRPDVVLSLHACDDATDQAIARGVQWDSRSILAAPCCQHELHHAIDLPDLRAVLRHGVLRERQADILTDAFRAAALRILGYRTDVIEFISPEHTGKNLMIRAVRTARPGHAPSIQEYQALKHMWGVTPVIETLLEEQLSEFL